MSGYKGHDMPKELKGFNWGACILTFIWGIPHKAWVTLLAITLIFIQLPLGINWALLTALQIYCGIKGNEWAYQTDYKLSEAQFRMKQFKWGAFALTISFLIPVIFFTIIMKFMLKDPDNPTYFIQNAQCSIVYDKLEKGLKRTILTMDSTSEDIAQRFAKADKGSIASESSVLYGKGSNNQRIDVLKITFSKENNAICSHEKENCKAVSSYILPEEIFEFNNCVFYFNNRKELLPDKATQEMLDKGLNIFKYL